MIWAIVSKDEMENYSIPPVFQYYREVLGKENIKLVVVDEDNPLDFVYEDDIVLLRSANEKIINNIIKKKITTTAEFYDLYKQVGDKKQLSEYLSKKGISVPKQFILDEVDEDKIYFVKPRYGGESFGITKESICVSKDKVANQVKFIEDECNQDAVIEEFIKGVDCTVACYYDHKDKEVKTHAIKIECEEQGGIQTHKGKFDYNEYCFAMTGEEKERICHISRKVFKLLGLKHHARIDYRMDYKGDIYLIDINLLPGLGPSAHFSKCLLLTDNISYKDAIKAIVNTASKIN